MTKGKVSLTKTILFTVCSILVLDSFVVTTTSGARSITVWIITALVFFLPYGLISAELGSTYPDDGGITSWVNRAFGDFWGVMEGWMYWIYVALWIPAVFTAFAGWTSLALSFLGIELPIWAEAGLAVAMCWVIVYIGIKGVDLSVNVASIMAYLKMGILVLAGILGIVYGIENGLANDFSAEAWIPEFSDIISFSGGGIFGAIVHNLVGFELIGSVASSIDNPKKIIPKMTIISGIAIVAVYGFGSFGVLAAVPADSIDEVDGFVYALRELCTVFGSAGNVIFYIVLFGANLTLVANIITWTLGSNESFMSAGLDKRSKFLGKRHPEYNTPVNLYIIDGVVSSGLCILNYCLTGDANDVFWALFSFSSIICLLCYVIEFAAAVKLKFTDNTRRVYCVPGGKTGMVICAGLCMISVVLAILGLVDYSGGSGTWMQVIGLAVTFAAGIYLYAAGKPKKENN